MNQVSKNKQNMSRFDKGLVNFCRFLVWSKYPLLLTIFLVQLSLGISIVMAQITFKNQVTGEAIDSKLDPQAKAVL